MYPAGGQNPARYVIQHNTIQFYVWGVYVYSLEGVDLFPTTSRRIFSENNFFAFDRAIQANLIPDSTWRIFPEITGEV